MGVVQFVWPAGGALPVSCEPVHPADDGFLVAPEISLEGLGHALFVSRALAAEGLMVCQSPKDQTGAVVEPLLNEGVAEIMLAAIGQDIVAIPASVRNDVIMVVVRMGNAVGLRAITEEGYAAVIRPADGAVLEANEQPDNIPASL
jgi:hypothetical protein